MITGVAAVVVTARLVAATVRAEYEPGGSAGEGQAASQPRAAIQVGRPLLYRRWGWAMLAMHPSSTAPRRRRIDLPQRERMASQRQAGRTFQAIAEEEGVGEVTVLRICRGHR
jgi:hypothetical protein